MSRRALVVEQPGSLALLEREELRPGPGEVLIRPAYCGLCGTDLELRDGAVDTAFVRYPVTLGHEWSGRVEALGEGVDGLEPGQACVAEGIIPCGVCASCRAGATNVCEVYDEVGFTREGGAGDQIVVPARVVHRLADDVSLLDAAVVEPSAVVLTGLEKIQAAHGLRIVVVGDGTIALLTVLLLQLRSPAELLVVGRRPEQEQLALELGATGFSLEAPPTGFDLAVEAAGSTDAVAVALGAVQRGGTVLQLGLPPAGSTLALPGDLLVNNDLTLAGSFGYTSAAWARVVALLNDGTFRPGRLVTHTFGLEEFGDAFAELAEPTGRRGKIVLDVARG
jgi:threonine dehydrogenase-like Zn-dependent dehydrogenase